MVPRIVILGGGFGGLYCALELEKTLAKDGLAKVTLVNRENFSLFTPMLHEVAASDVDHTHIVNPIRRLLQRVEFFNGEVESIDHDQRIVKVSHGDMHHTHDLPYDHLVVALGAVTHDAGIRGVAQDALTMKTLHDAVKLRDRMIDRLEQAVVEDSAEARRRLLTIVVAGAGFAGTETVGGVHDFLEEAARWYPTLRREEIRVVLVHSGAVILPELGVELGMYAQQQLTRRGVEVRLGARVASYDDACVVLTDGTRIPADTLVWTAGNKPNPLVATLAVAQSRGRLVVDTHLAVSGATGLWAVGDIACIPDGASRRDCPPTAQHALRQGRHVARNIIATLAGRPLEPFRFESPGALAAIGRRTGVARLFGHNFSGFAAWWLWRTVYLSKLPRFEKKVRVLLDWTLDLMFSKDLVQFSTFRERAPMAPEDPKR